jgi:sugar diacid utilization regulator
LIQVAGVPDTESGQQTELVRRRLLSLLQQVTSTRSRQSLVIHRNGLFTVLWPQTHNSQKGQPITVQAVAKAIQEAIAAIYADRVVNIGIGRPYDELKRLRESFEEASCALHILQRLGTKHAILSFTDLGIYRVLLQTSSPQHLLDFSKDTLEPIRTHDTQWKGGLEATLRMYLQYRANTKKTAEAMFVHPNTVMYRLRKLEQVCGIELEDLQQLMRLQLAIMIQDVAG